MAEVAGMPCTQGCPREQVREAREAAEPQTRAPLREKPEIYASLQNPLIPKYWQLMRAENSIPAEIQPGAHGTLLACGPQPPSLDGMLPVASGGELGGKRGRLASREAA